MADKTTDEEVTRRAAELVRAADGSAAKQADEEARAKLTTAELDMARVLQMEPREYLRYKSPHPEAA